MFFKAAALLLLAGAVAAQVAEGTYRIVSAVSLLHGASIYAPTDGGDLFVSARPKASSFQQWDITPAFDGIGFLLYNVGAKGYAAIPIGAPLDGEPVFTSPRPTVFDIIVGFEGRHTIRERSRGFVWNADPPFNPDGAVKLRKNDGRTEEQWYLDPIH